jgi:hypothetical protein
MGIFKEIPVCRLYSEEEGTTSHVVFRCQVLAPRFNLLGITNQGEEIPTKNLVNRLLDLIKGTNLFTQELMDVEKHI